MTTETLYKKANLLRQHTIRMLEKAGSGHSAGPLGMADIYASLYFSVMRHRPKQPDWPMRDRLVLSCGHTVPIRYAAMAEAGYFSISELATLRQFGSRLQGHPHVLSMPGLESSSGPLGQGLSQAIGMAMAGRLRKQRFHTYCVLSDGEHQEGQIWEGLMFAAREKLSQLTVIVDRNYIQIDGPTESVLPLEPLGEKYRSFGWHVLEINGNSIEQFLEATAEAKIRVDAPTAIIAHTVPGKGVSFMEYDFHWHGLPPNHQQAQQALREIRSLRGQIRGDHD
jgi:transketolase